MELNQTDSLLQQMEKNENASSFADALGLLEKLLTNILSYPGEEKYRHIKMSVKALATRLFNIKQMTELLTVLGFIQMDQEFYLPAEHYDILLESFNQIRWQNILAQARLEGHDAIQKAQEVIHQQKQVQKQLEKDQKDKEKIQQQINYDQQERKLVKQKDAVANDLKFGAKEKVKVGDVERGESHRTFASHLFIKKTLSQH